MSSKSNSGGAEHTGGAVAMAVLNAIQNPVVMVNEAGLIAFANWEAEAFFGASASHLSRYEISTFIPFGSPLQGLALTGRERNLRPRQRLPEEDGAAERVCRQKGQHCPLAGRDLKPLAGE